MVDSTQELERATRFLIKEEELLAHERGTSITYKGVIKIKGGGYRSVMYQKRIMLRLNQWFWILGPIISLLSLAVAVFALWKK